MSDLFTSDFKTDPYWWDQVPRPELKKTAPPKTTDVVVIGSGYTGLNAALQTARAGRETVVLDAEAAGWGCSTRNGGQISTSIKPSYQKLKAKYGHNKAFAICKEGHNSLAWIEQFITAENIDCDFSVCGRFHAAHNAKQYETLAKNIGNEPEGLEVNAELVPRTEQRRELGTDAYFGGVVFPKHASLHPARYHRVLLNNTLAAGAKVITYCAALGVDREGKNFRIKTANGDVLARNVIVASNGYTGKITPWQRRRVIPIGSYIIATEVIDADLMRQLVPTNRVLSDTRKVVFYYRPSPDRTRILFGGRVSFNESDPTVSGPLLHAELVKIFPELAATKISHSWVGFVAYTFDDMAHIGEHDGVHYAMGYCGSGVSMASYLGMRVGQQVLGLTQGQTGLNDVTFQTRPLYTGNPWFLAPSVRYYKWRDG